MTPDPLPLRLVLITGPSGAGLSTASSSLEDAGYEAIDNLPLRLVKPLLSQPEMDRPMALCIDTRNRDFTTRGFLDMVDELADDPKLDVQLLYLDCRAEELLRRYSATRRRHPMLQAPSLGEAIAREKDLLRPIRARADILINSSELNPHQLRAEVAAWLAPEGQLSSAVQIQSFSYKRGLPGGVDMVFDCRILRNPYWDEALRSMDGRDKAVQAYVAEDPRFEEFFRKIREFVLFVLPAAQDEGKSYVSVGFGCTGGQHRSVTVAEALADALAEEGWQVSIRHREVGPVGGKEAES